MTSPDYYDTLGVSPDASPQEIRAAYKRESLKHHPDRNTGNKKKATEKFQVKYRHQLPA